MARGGAGAPTHRDAMFVLVFMLSFRSLQSFNEYFSNEHSRLLHLWRAVVAFRRQFSEMKSATERDLSHVRADVTRASRSMHSACLNMSANARNQDTQNQVGFPAHMLQKCRFLCKINRCNTACTCTYLGILGVYIACSTFTVLARVSRPGPPCLWTEFP